MMKSKGMENKALVPNGSTKAPAPKPAAAKGGKGKGKC